MRAVVLVLLVGCRSISGSGDDTDLVPTLGEPCSVEHVTGTIPGVDISISSDSCTYRRGQAATFRFTVVTTADVPAIDVPETNTCDCDHRSTDIASWVGWTISGTASSGESQQYCFCDTGCCAPQDAVTIRPTIGGYDQTITWSGHTWQGPSDTGNSEGSAFLTGTYAVYVGFSGFAQGSVSAMLPIEIVP